MVVDRWAAAKKKIDDAYAEITSGKINFADAALKYSDDAATNIKGGELPPFSTGKMIPEFETQAFALKNDGDISAPFMTPYGWHIVKRLSYKPLPSFEEAKSELKTKISHDSRAEVTRQKFLAGLRTLCDEHGILLIFDEVQSGVGRTGKMFACEHSAVSPDIMTLAKGLGSGLPIGAVVARKSLMSQWKRGAHGNTYGGNPLACAAANATLAIFRDQPVLERNRGLAAHMRSAVAHLQGHPHVAEIRQRGMILAIELMKDVARRQPWGIDTSVTGQAKMRPTGIPGFHASDQSLTSRAPSTRPTVRAR